MIDPFNLIDKLKRYYTFSAEELRWLAVSIVVMTFIVGFNDGRESFELMHWLSNLFLGFIAVVIAVVAHETAHRIVGLEQGYKTQFKPAFYGLIAGLILSFMSYGKIIFLMYGGVFLNMLEKHRLGYFRYQLGYFHYGAVALFGPVANIAAAIFFKVIPILPGPLADKVVFVNLLFAVTNMLPIPGVDGPNVLFASRWLYFLSFGAMVGISFFLIKGFTWWVVALAALLGALVFWLGYYYVIEKKL